MVQGRARASILIAAVAVAICAWPRAASAQAWLPSQGEGSVSVQWQNVFSRDHFVPVARIDIGHINSNALIVDATYGLTDKLALDASVPYISSKYTGPQPHPTALDDGNYHGTFQDFRFAVRYNIVGGRFALSPFVGSILPSHNYEYYAHAAPGRRVRELQTGVYLATLLDRVMPGGFVQARIGYGFMQTISGVSHGRGMLDLEIGDFVTDRLRVFAIGNGQLTRGGIDIPLAGPIGLPAVMQSQHDRIDCAHFLNVGGGASFTLRESLDVFGSLVTSVANRNGHSMNRGLDIGVSWAFKRRGGPAGQRARNGVDDDRTAEADALTRCVCQRDR